MIDIPLSCYYKFLKILFYPLCVVYITDEKIQIQRFML